MTPLSKRLRDQALSLRRTSAPLSYLIPLLQQAADALDAPQLILNYLAKWENENGTLCAITPEEWMALMEPITKLAVLESPRQALNAIEKPRRSAGGAG